MCNTDYGIGDFLETNAGFVWVEVSGEIRLDRSGILIGEMAARNDLIVLNRGRGMTYKRGARGTILLTLQLLYLVLPHG